MLGNALKETNNVIKSKERNDKQQGLKTRKRCFHESNRKGNLYSQEAHLTKGSVWCLKLCLSGNTQSVRTVEYTNCSSAERKGPPPTN